MSDPVFFISHHFTFNLTPFPLFAGVLAKCWRNIKPENSVTVQESTVNLNRCCRSVCILPFELSDRGPLNSFGFVIQVYRTCPAKLWWNRTVPNAWTFTHQNRHVTSIRTALTSAPASHICYLWCTQNIVLKELLINLFHGNLHFTNSFRILTFRRVLTLLSVSDFMASRYIH